MVAGRPGLTLSWIAWIGSIACHPAPSAPSRGSAAAPTAAAVFVHDDTGDRLHVADFARAQFTPIGPEREVAHQPVWSPDGARLAYRIGDRLFVHSDGATRDAAVTSGVDLEAVRPYAFSPDGRRLAIALRGALAMAAIAPGAADIASATPFASYPGHQIGDLGWSPDGATLVALVRDAEPSLAAQLAWIPVSGGTTRLVDARGTLRLLGWRSGELLIVGASDGRERVVSMPPPGRPDRSPSPIALAPYKGEDLSVVDYAGGPDLVVMAPGGDPDGDTSLRIASPGGATVPWLAAHPRSSDFALTADGTWALFVDRATGGERPGGSVHVVRVGAEDARVVLSASSARSFSAPVPRPSR